MVRNLVLLWVIFQLAGCHQIFGYGTGTDRPDGWRLDRQVVTFDGSQSIPDRNQSTEAGSGDLDLVRRDSPSLIKKDGSAKLDTTAKLVDLTVKQDGCTPSLNKVLAPAVETAVTAFNNTQDNGVSSEAKINPPVLAYQLAGCASTEQQAIDRVLAEVQGSFTFQDGTVTAAVAGGCFFGSTYSSKGPALFAAAMTFGGGGNATLWSVEAQGTCHNCDKFEVTQILYFPASRKVLRFDGYYMWE